MPGRTTTVRGVPETAWLEHQALMCRAPGDERCRLERAHLRPPERQYLPAPTHQTCDTNAAGLPGRHAAARGGKECVDSQAIDLVAARRSVQRGVDDHSDRSAAARIDDGFSRSPIDGTHAAARDELRLSGSRTSASDIVSAREETLRYRRST